MADIHRGGCVCGSVRYHVTGQPQRVSMCSCSWCKKRTGSAFGISAYFEQNHVFFECGNLKAYELQSDAGRWIKSEFCGNCGTVLSWTLEFLPGLRGIAGGSFDAPTFWCKPQRYVFTRSKPDWLDVPEGMMTCEGMPVSQND